jgi:MBG domain-containing protein
VSQPACPTTDGSGIATLSGVSLAGINAGNHPSAVGASFAGDALYASTTGSGTLIVSKATPTLTWNNPGDIVYGTALSSTQLNATASVPGTFVYTPLSNTVLHAGNGQTLHVDFTPTDSTNYATASKNVLINVLKAPLTITADNKVKLVGDANPPLSFTPTGFVNGDTASVLTGSPSLSTTATNSSPVGNYPITITQGTLAASDYAFSFVNGTLSVTEPAPVILLETATTNAAAVDSVTFVRGPFSVTDNFNFSGDHITRIIIFTAPLANPDATLKVFASGHELQVENFGSVTGVPGLSASYIVVKLDPVLTGSGPINYDLTVSLRGVTSNTATLTIIP